MEIPSARALHELLVGSDAADDLQGPCWIAWRQRGALVSGRWYKADRLYKALERALKNLSEQPATAVEICLTRNFREVAHQAFGSTFPNSARGRRGIELRYGDRLHRVAPTQTIATNRSFKREFELFSDLVAPAHPTDIGIRCFDASSSLVMFESDLKKIDLYRGNEVFNEEGVGAETAADVRQRMEDWLLRQIGNDGEMAYKYWPSRGAYSKANNTIRQFMATLAVGRIAARRQDAAACEKAQRNLAYNLKSFYREIDGIGTILFEGKAKLGATALAALAILEFRRNRLVPPQAYATEFDGLVRCVDQLWTAEGAFRTFLLPADRNDNQNFYPGEALCFWAEFYRETTDPALLQKCRQSFAHYSAWHRAAPNPAFVPWHTQAYKTLFDLTGERALAEFIFERNDWLLSMQQWEGDVAPDFRGRFYDPRHPEYGPPHASSTGVYMEGLAEAWALARDLGEEGRAAQYATALRRGLRSIAQLQFRDADVDAYYIQRKQAVMGALRTETYNNEIRVDNVQHGLMALMKLDALSNFSWSPADQSSL